MYSKTNSAQLKNIRDYINNNNATTVQKAANKTKLRIWPADEMVMYSKRTRSNSTCQQNTKHTVLVNGRIGDRTSSLAAHKWYKEAEQANAMLLRKAAHKW